jgi:hypothetical protein
VSRWFRHYAGMMRDDKLVRVAIRSKQTIERVAWVWGAILESASEIDDGGRYDLDAAEIAYFLRADESDVDAILGALSDACRVADSHVVKWGNRQFSSDRSRERVASHRERKRAQGSDGNGEEAAGNGDVTLQACHGNSPEAETETELETEEEGSSKDDSSSGDEPALEINEVFQGYRSLATDLALKTVPRDLTPERRQLLRFRIRQYPLADFQTVFSKCRDSPFLRGDRGRTPLTFDWLFKKANFQKTLEGNYD